MTDHGECFSQSHAEQTEYHIIQQGSLYEVNWGQYVYIMFARGHN